MNLTEKTKWAEICQTVQQFTLIFLHEYIFVQGLSIKAITEVHNEAKFCKSEKSIIVFFQSKKCITI